MILNQIPFTEKEDLQTYQKQIFFNLLLALKKSKSFYFKHLKDVNLKTIKSLVDLRELPFTTKADLVKSYPFSFFNVSLEKIIRLHATSGSTADPLVVGYTKRDLMLWQELTARLMKEVGVGKNDVVHILFQYGLFTGGLGFHQGATDLGACVVPVSSGQSERQLKLMKDFKATTLLGTPSYLIYLCDKAKELGLTAKNFSVKRVLCGAETWSEAMREKIQDFFKAPAYDNYGLSELIGPGVAYECQAQKGLHVSEDAFLVEVIDPKTLKILPQGEWGELVFTSLHKEAFPLLRYRTRDISRLLPQRCSCGSLYTRIDRIRGRSDDMLIVKGINIYPSQIESVLLKDQRLMPHYEIHLKQSNFLDEMEIKAEVAHHNKTNYKTIQKEISSALKNTLNISPKLTLFKPFSLKRTEGKAKRVIDTRNQ